MLITYACRGPTSATGKRQLAHVKCLWLDLDSIYRSTELLRGQYPESNSFTLVVKNIGLLNQRADL